MEKDRDSPRFPYFFSEPPDNRPGHPGPGADAVGVGPVEAGLHLPMGGDRPAQPAIGGEVGVIAVGPVIAQYFPDPRLRDPVGQ